MSRTTGDDLGLSDSSMTPQRRISSSTLLTSAPLPWAAFSEVGGSVGRLSYLCSNTLDWSFHSPHSSQQNIFVLSDEILELLEFFITWIRPGSFDRVLYC
jgi:hypothetical protein